MSEERIVSADLRDNNVEWVCGDNVITASFYSKKYINRLTKLASKYPDEVQVKENEDGSILCHFPLRYLKITRPAEREVTEEQKQAAAKRFAKYREQRQKPDLARVDS